MKHIVIAAIIFLVLGATSAPATGTARAERAGSISGHHTMAHQGKAHSAQRHHQRHVARKASPSPRHPAHQLVLSGTFPVFPLAGSGVRGSVQVTSRNGSTFLTVSLQGLAPGSTHAVHVHAGSCQNPYGGMHLYILGFPTANMSGAAVIGGVGPNPYVPGARYVIVYGDTSPSTIIGCANLGMVSAH